MLVPGNESFVGQFPIPMRHGMTIGELARFFNEYFEIKAPLEVIEMEGWSRSMYFDQTGLPFVMPSPNIPTLDSAIVYPGTVLFEGTNASEARGTTRPFELVGAPWVEAERFADEMNARKLPGVHFRPAVFEPTFQKHAKKTCGGCQIHVLDRKAFKPVLTGVALIDAIKAAGPKDFALAQAALRIRARKGADRHPRRLAGAQNCDRWREKGRRISAGLGTGEQALRGSSGRISCVFVAHGDRQRRSSTSRARN